MTDSKLVKQGISGLAEIIGDVDLTQRPDFIPEGDRTGTEGITSEDIRLPRLGIAQGLSPQVTPGDGSYIKGLALFDLFNDSTSEVYGTGPLYFVAVRRDVRCIEFIPRNEGGGIRDLNVPRNDPRATQWRQVEIDGVVKRLPPVATLFNEFVVLLLKKNGSEFTTEPIVISVKSTNKYNRRAITDLNGYIKMHGSQGAKSVPIYGVIYSIESKPEKNDRGTFGVPVFKQVGFVPPTLQSVYEQAAEYAKSLEGKTIVIEREPGDESEASVDGEVVGEKAPF
jgi:hypothetical protein